ncbi:MAG: hypothetical protein IT430_16170 [Phycisphaerales bacterium]|nr:hypothetical protein [Phycisphaerales bacterium]
MLMKHGCRIGITVVLGVALLGGCKKQESSSGNGAPAKLAFNASCPVDTGQAVSLKSPTVEYKGVAVAFCCEDCIKTWNEWPESKKDEFVAAAKKKLEEVAPEEDPGH